MPILRSHREWSWTRRLRRLWWKLFVIHVSTLPSVTITLVPRQENVDNGQAGKVGAVPDGLHPGYRPPYLQERFCLGPQAQIISVHYIGFLLSVTLREYTN